MVMLSGVLRCDKLQRHTTWGHHQEGGASEATLVNKVSDNVMDDEQQIDAAGLAALERFSNERGLPEQFGTVFLQWYAGVTAALAKRAGTSESPLLVGLSGCQGSGKSTLVDAMARILADAHGVEPPCYRWTIFISLKRSASPLPSGCIRCLPPAGCPVPMISLY